MKATLALFALALVSLACADTKYYVVYVQGHKIGYNADTTRPDKLNGRSVQRTDEHSVMTGTFGGSTVKTVTDETAWADADGKPLRSQSRTKSGNDVQDVVVVYGAKSADVTVQSGKSKTHKVVPIPYGSLIDDPLKIAKMLHPKPGQHLSVWSLDTDTFSFQKVQFTIGATKSTTVHGSKVSANEVDVTMSGITVDVFVDGAGNLIRAEGPMGMEFLPEPKEIALAESDKAAGSIDLEEYFSLKTDKPIENSEHLTDLKLLISGLDLSKVPTDTNQSVSKQGDAWLVDVHPVRLDTAPAATIASLTGVNDKWLQPGIDLPSDSATFRALAKKIGGGNTDLKTVVDATVRYVDSIMKYQIGGIDSPKSASDILASKTGVCLDYAILTATLLRAEGIPTRLVVGLVYDDGAFFGHAWDEVWDGQVWVGIDPTNAYTSLSAEYIKLSQGTVQEAFQANYPLGGKISLISATH